MRLAHPGLRGLIRLCRDLGVWADAGVGGIRPLQLTLRERNVGLIHSCHGEPSMEWEPVQGAVPFMRVPEIMDEMVLVRLEQPPMGNYTFFPFEPLGAPSTAQPRMQVTAQTLCGARVHRKLHV